jgi:hypothetical protein
MRDGPMATPSKLQFLWEEMMIDQQHMTIFSDKAERKGSIGIVSVETYQFPGAVARCIVFRWGVFSIFCGNRIVFS